MDYCDAREIGKWEYIVSLVRANKDSMPVEAMAKIFGVPEKDCHIIINLIEEYPEWDDGTVLRGVMGYKICATEIWKRINALTQCIIDHGGGGNEIAQAFSDESYCAELCREYGIEPW